MTPNRYADIERLLYLLRLCVLECHVPKSAPEVRQALRSLRLGAAREAVAEAAARSGLSVAVLMAAALSIGTEQGQELIDLVAAHELAHDGVERVRARAELLNALASVFAASEGSASFEAVRRFVSGEKPELPAWGDPEKLPGNAVVICIAVLASAGVAPLGALAAGALGTGAPVALAATVDTAVTALTGGIVALMITKIVERAATTSQRRPLPSGPPPPVVGSRTAPASQVDKPCNERSATPPVNLDCVRPSPVSCAETYQPPDPDPWKPDKPPDSGGPVVNG